MNNNLRRDIRKILFEDTWQKYGSEYMSHPVGQGDPNDKGQQMPADNEADSWDSFQLPVGVSNLMPNNIAVEKPPIDDEEYSPVNPKALSKALAAIGEEIPDSKVEDFYQTVKREVESLGTLPVEDDVEEPTEEQEEEEADEAELESELEELSKDTRYWPEVRLSTSDREDSAYIDPSVPLIAPPVPVSPHRQLAALA